MSYFSANNIAGTDHKGIFSATPLLDDIAAAQRLYGANMTTRTGDTIYGFNSNADRAVFKIASATQQVVFAIWDAGGNNDTLDFSGYSSDQIIDLNAGKFSSVGILKNNVAIAVGAHIEHAKGGKKIDDIFGNSLDNRLTGGAGNDNLHGESGQDTLQGDAGIDTLFGSSGNDTLIGGADGDDNFGGSGDDIIVIKSAEAHLDDFNGGDDTDSIKVDGATAVTLSGFDASKSSIEVWIGNAAGVKGDPNTNVLDFSGLTQISGLGLGLIDGAGGNDTIKGTIFDDILINGGAGDDKIFGGEGKDRLLGGANADELDGGADNDVLDGGTHNDILTGGDGEDKLLGGANDDKLYGGDAIDFADGGTGNDLVRGGDGGDTLIGGVGIDTLSYLDSSGAVDIELRAKLAALTSGGNADGDIATLFENVIGSGFDDTLTGDTGANRLDGFDGEDTLDGGAGNDKLFGGKGNDDYFVDSVLDEVTENDGEGDLDTVFSKVTYKLSNNVEDLYLEGIAAINGTGNGSDNYIEGNTAPNNLSGGDGDDILDGGGGNDFLDGGAGEDDLYGGEGEFDVASYASAKAALTINLADPFLSTGDAEGDSYDGVELVSGSNFADTIVGAANAPNILIGAGGGDKLIGGNQIDLAAYAFAAKGVVANLGSPGANTNEAAGDTYEFIEGLVGSKFNDWLIGDGKDNILIGYLGADKLHGGDGWDIAAYYLATGSVKASLASSSTNTGEAKGDTYVSIEGLMGGDFDDVLTGDAKDNIFIGGLGADKFFGGGGDDEVSYATSDKGVRVNMQLVSDGTNDAAGDEFNSIEGLTGSMSDDVLTGNLNAPTWFEGGMGADSFTGGLTAFDMVIYDGSINGVSVNLATNQASGGDAQGDSYNGIELVTGSSLADVLIGNSASNLLIGGGSGDTLDGGTNGSGSIGGGEFDHLVGNEGDDIYIVDNQNDRVDEFGADAHDEVWSYVSFDLTDTQNGTGRLQVENLTLVGNGDVYAKGNALGNVIEGNDNTNLIYGGGGTDLLTGNGGTDIFLFDLNSDTDVIQDFDLLHDVIQIKIPGVTDFEDHILPYLVSGTLTLPGREPLVVVNTPTLADHPGVFQLLV